jgi:hypothetical protein
MAIRDLLYGKASATEIARALQRPEGAQPSMCVSSTCPPLFTPFILGITDINVGTDGARAIVEALKVSSSLQELGLENTFLFLFLFPRDLMIFPRALQQASLIRSSKGKSK